MNSGRLWEVRMRAWDRLWAVRMGVNRIKCWFIGHSYGMAWYRDKGRGPDYCNRCFIDEPQDRTALPDLLCRGYCWLVDRHWSWFDRLDEWLCENYRLPDWWTY